MTSIARSGTEAVPNSAAITLAGSSAASRTLAQAESGSVAPSIRGRLMSSPATNRGLVRRNDLGVLRLRSEGRRRGRDLYGSASVIYGLRSCGFYKEGIALDFIQNGHIELDGELPLNTFGGSLGTAASTASGKSSQVSCRPQPAPDRAR